jgi:hypothetical protein
MEELLLGSRFNMGKNCVGRGLELIPKIVLPGYLKAPLLNSFGNAAMIKPFSRLQG